MLRNSNLQITPGVYRRVKMAIAAAFAAATLLLIASLPQQLDAAEAQHEMVVAESEPAALAGLQILHQGGNAIDAAVATALALGVTNAASCGIGGGGFMLIYLAKPKKLYALDYREVAPKAATAAMYIRNGTPDEDLARTGALAIAVPGEIAGLDAALKRFGTKKFSELAAPAIKLARDGFPLSPHVAKEVAMTAPLFASDPVFHTIYFTLDGKPQAAGTTIYNRNLATLMERLGNDPVANFYHGVIADTIASFIKERGGIVTAEDLAAYQPVWSDPIHLAYRNYEVYTMPPPSSGGVVLEMLGMLSMGRLAGLGVDSPPYLARLIEVLRQGFIDRAALRRPGIRQRTNRGTALDEAYRGSARPRVSSHQPAAGGPRARSRNVEFRNRGQGGQRGRCDDDGQYDLRREVDGALVRPDSQRRDGRLCRGLRECPTRSNWSATRTMKSRRANARCRACRQSSRSKMDGRLWSQEVPAARRLSAGYFR